MGDEDIDTTMIYVRLVESQKDQAVKALSDFKKNCNKFATQSSPGLVPKSA